ncbi:ParB/RepB/Spo0J family partition protein [Xylella fastidiosa subsp. fastidiosa]|jgi:ParB family chromosome partitioning protein|uniref:Probable chromosome-partitioning protein ParB n=2 Tax=Xylella fastidiosa TaxID=2371 RepID=PARB_XYLFT|nr:ParB/RepB/Spo0J family partition protein [Xylella fastidiosa]Q87BY1.1 RecName: Full=Probable chromosome-partitioning protein ParB [Xylella fastidiosa Temecula1]ADN62156.1 chromosome partitioning protein [Xylella fastidiosa subsp. fastidiosa GB514]AAO29164.1 chromosome partitioning protein [Xylella fastidiosa Temecula1]ACB92817.1 parB-like partition protein [Xylella fastidiosa M23]EGO82424.1 transcriptional regulator [Xylella fastidiosa EB92.1]KGM20041.1 chromosome partitioning protein ParB
MNKPSLPLKKRGLGRGLEALLGSKGGSSVPPTVAQEQLPGEVLRTLQTTQLQPSKYQPRREMSEAKLAELADSIKAQGVIQPIIVRELDVDMFEIVAGERRWRASQLAGLTEVPVIVRELDDRTVVAMALIENIQREDLNPLEEAQALQRLIDEFSLTHAEAAEAVGRSRAAVSNLLRLLELPLGIRTLLESHQLEMGHARALLTLTPELAAKLAKEAADQGWSVREVEHRAQQFAAGKVPDIRDKKSKSLASAPAQPDIASLETELSERLGTKVAINHGRTGKGKLVIHYTDLDVLDGVLERLRARAVG